MCRCNSNTQRNNACILPGTATDGSRNHSPIFSRVGTASAWVKKWNSAMWAIWFCHELLQDHKQVLINALQELIKHSKSVNVWSNTSNSLCKLVKFTSQDTLTAVRQTWVMWVQGCIHIVHTCTCTCRLDAPWAESYIMLRPSSK